MPAAIVRPGGLLHGARTLPECNRIGPVQDLILESPIIQSCWVLGSASNTGLSRPTHSTIRWIISSAGPRTGVDSDGSQSARFEDNLVGADLHFVEDRGASIIDEDSGVRVWSFLPNSLHAVNPANLASALRSRLFSAPIG